MIARALLLLALCAGGLHAQQRVEATPLGRLLEAATRRGLFARVEGVRHYRLGGGEDLVLIQVDVKRDDQELYLQSTVNHLSAERPVLRAVNLHLGPAGQIVKLRLILRTPEQEVTATGRVKDDQIEFEFTEGKQINVQTFPWSDLSVPGNVVLFVLPCFPELLPKEGWSFVQFDEQGLASGPRTIRAEQTPDGTRVRVRVTHTDSGALQTEAVLNQNGRLISLLRGEQRIVEVTAHEAQRLTEEARARREAFERHQRAHPPQDPPPPDAPTPPEDPKPDAPKPDAPKPPEDPEAPR